MEFTKHVQVREEKFGAVVFETLKEKVYVTNPTGADIVRLIGQKRSPEQIIAELARSYGTTPAAIAGDVDAFIALLTQNGVIQ